MGSCRAPYTAANAHAHNDYEHPLPFFAAWNAGFGSIEADIFPVNGVLLVAHNKEDIRKEKTLQSLYLEPIRRGLEENPRRKLRLLIDIKQDYAASLKLLQKELGPLTPFLYSSSSPNRLTILISGLRPPPAMYHQYPDYIFFDDDLKLPHNKTEWERVGLVSLSFTRVSGWKGMGNIPAADKSQLRHVIDSVHAAGKQIRFWAAPDTRDSWKWQKKLRADLIGTDDIAGFADWLKK